MTRVTFIVKWTDADGVEHEETCDRYGQAIDLSNAAYDRDDTNVAVHRVGENSRCIIGKVGSW